MLVVNSIALAKRADTLRDKGTNRVDFLSGKVDKYQWIDIGSSFSMNELSASFLYAQLQYADNIQQKRKELWQTYFNELASLEKEGKAQLPKIPTYATHNNHIFYLICKNLKDREQLIAHLKKKAINAVFHNQSLHKSQYYKDKHDGRNLINADSFSECLIRLPLYFELSKSQQKTVIDSVLAYYK
jgi:dTDP-4-amino-4,6-dideoxygalactose transaminase